MIHLEKSVDSRSQKLELVRDCNCVSLYILAGGASQYGFEMRGTVDSTTAQSARYGYFTIAHALWVVEGVAHHASACVYRDNLLNLYLPVT